jgi:glycosyltransferase involved in cell wall biosynthesis
VSPPGGLPAVYLVAGKDPRDGRGTGHDNYVRAHARAAAGAGYRTHLVFASRRSETVATDLGQLHGVRSPFRPLRQQAAPLHNPRIAAHLVRLLRGRPGPHLIHGFGVWGAAGVAAARQLARVGVAAVPILSSYTTREHESRGRIRGARTPARRLRAWATHAWIRLAVERPERRAHLGAQLVLVNYESVRRLLVAKFGEGLPVRRVPYTCESAFLPEADGAGRDPPPALAALGAPTAPLVLAVCRHDTRKGLEVLLRALAALGREGHRFRLCLVGEGPLRDRHRGLAADLGLAAVTALPGYVPDPRPYLRHADVFVQPSLAEGSGSVAVLEALQSGRAVVASRLDGIPEDVTDGESGLLVEPGSMPALAAALARLLADRSLRQRLGERARQVFTERFSATGFVRALGEVYAGLGFGP